MAWKEIKSEVKELEKVNDFVEGEYVSLEKAGKFDDSHLLSIQEKDKNGVTQVWANAVLRGRVAGCKPGDKIKVVFIGKATNKAGQEYKNYTVFRDV